MRWMAPETIKKRRYSEQSDVWAFGVTLFILLTGLPPWEVGSVVT